LFSINVAGTLFTLQAAAKVMIKQGRGGRIINMASQARRRSEALVAVYCATKAAVISLTQSAGLNPVRKIRESPARREEAPRRRGGPVRPHGHRRRSGRDGNIPRRTGKHLRRRPDLQCRWLQLDELRNEAMTKGSLATVGDLPTNIVRSAMSAAIFNSGHWHR